MTQKFAPTSKFGPSRNLAPTRRASRMLTLRWGRITLRVPRATVRLGLILAVAIAALSIVALQLGDYPLSFTDTFRALLGTGNDPLAQFFLQKQRAPRILTAILVGAALGVSGAIFQSFSGNPLGSPDIIGFTVGAATGALMSIVLWGGSPIMIAAGALTGGILTATLVYLLAWRDGLTGMRLVLVGIGVAAILQGVNSLLVVRASLTAAQTATQWLAGSFNATTWAEATLVGIAAVILIPLAFLLARPLTMMTGGDDLAVALGVNLGRRRLELVIVGVALVSVAVAAAGPIAFVALAAPHIAKKLARTDTVAFGVSALMGSTLVLASDLIAQRLFAPTQLPVGVVTGSLGGIYLVWLLTKERRMMRS